MLNSLDGGKDLTATMWQSRTQKGAGLRDAMERALSDAKLSPSDIDYVNAHAPSTSIGDASEMKALKFVFPSPQKVKVSSTKALTGHGLSLSSIMEAAFCCLSLREGFLPGSAHISQPDSELGHLDLLTDTISLQANHIMSNSSGFGELMLALFSVKPDPSSLLLFTSPVLNGSDSRTDQNYPGSSYP